MLVDRPNGRENGNREQGARDSLRPEQEDSATVVVTRRRPSKRTMMVIGAIVASALTLSAIWTLSGISEPTVTIVAIIPLSGNMSYLMEIHEAMSLTAEKLNKWGGINGVKIRLVALDCESAPEVAVARMIEAEEKYHPIAVVCSTRDAAIPIAEIAEEKDILLISVGASDENLAVGREWVFRYYVSPSDEARTALDILESLNISSVGILHLDDTYGRQVRDELTEEFEALGGVVESHGFPRDCEDFSDLATEVMGNDAVFAVANRYYYGNIFADLRASGYSGYLLGAVGASIPQMWSLPDAQGVHVNAPIMYSPTAEVDVEFMQDFEERFGKPLTHQGAIGSDILNLIWGLLTDSKVSRESLRDMMSSGFVYSGILGVVTLEQGAHSVDLAVYPAVIEGGGLEYL